MMKFSKTLAAGAAVPALALTLAAATPADAQSRYRDYDRREDNTAQNAIIGAVVGGLAGALIGNGDGSYVAGGALAGAAVGAAASNNNDRDCGYYRGGRCYRNQGHWEREHGINSRDYGYSYSYGPDRRYEPRRDSRRNDRDYRYERRW
jgi:uncharacterized protein YcfJ